MIEIMNEQHTQLVSDMRQFDLLSDTNPSLPSPRLEATLYDDCESFIPRKSNVVDNKPFTT